MNTNSDLQIGVIIVNYNSGDNIIKCIDSVYKQTVKTTDILIVDNGSTDSSISLIRSEFPDIKIIELTENLGLPAARNTGIEHMSTNLLLFVDDDAYLAPDCLYQMLSKYQQTDAQVICPRILFYPQKDTIQCDGATFHFIGTLMLNNNYKTVDKHNTEYELVSSCIGCCFIIDRKSVIESGCFDKNYFMCFEDVEFFYRLRAFGNKIMTEPKAIVYHDRGEGTADLSYRGRDDYPPFRAYLIMRGRLRTILLHYQLRTILLLFPILMLYEFCTFIYSMRRGWFKKWLNSWLWNLINLKEILILRQQYKCKRIVGDIDLLNPGPLPFTKGLFNSSIENSGVKILSHILNSYWHLVRPLLKNKSYAN